MMNNGRVAVVTGGASGIGEAVVRNLCSDGFSVAVIYNRSEAQAQALASELSATGSNIMVFKADISDSAQVNNVVNEINSKLGTPYLLVNNSGIAQQKLFTDITDDDWHNMINVNLSGAFYMCRAVLPFMIHEKAGRIVNISSMWETAGASCEAAYSATKAGVHGLTKALAKELAPSNIQVNAIACGVIDTDMNQQLSEEDKIILKNEIPASRFGDPQEVADMVIQLVNAPTYLTGQVIGFDGAYL
mgnify:CR=1 FL=1